MGFCPTSCSHPRYQPSLRQDRRETIRFDSTTLGSSGISSVYAGSSTNHIHPDHFLPQTDEDLNGFYKEKHVQGGLSTTMAKQPWLFLLVWGYWRLTGPDGVGKVVKLPWLDPSITAIWIPMNMNLCPLRATKIMSSSRPLAEQRPKHLAKSSQLIGWEFAHQQSQ